jgi:hypothetical protein
MHPHLRDRILKKLEGMTDERAYQVLDYADFLDSRYSTPTAPQPTLLERFTDGVEDTLRAGKVSATAVAETMSLLNRAMGVLGGVAEAGKSVASSAVGVVQGVAAASKSVADELRTAGQGGQVGQGAQGGQASRAKGQGEQPGQRSAVKAQSEQKTAPEQTEPLPPQPGESEPG